VRDLFDSGHVEFASSATAPPAVYERVILLQASRQW
jgi:hypothetical protein